MAIFKGFNTIGQHKKFGITDFNLIKRDLLNAFLTREGTLPGRPDLGTSIWSYVFEANILETRNAIDTEVRRIIKGDSRLELTDLDISYSHNTVIIEVAVILLPSASPEKLILQFNKDLESLEIT